MNSDLSEKYNDLDLISQINFYRDLSISYKERGANIWDIIQSAYLIEKNCGQVFYENGENIFPLDPNILVYKDNHLIMPFTIACTLDNKEKIMRKLSE